VFGNNVVVIQGEAHLNSQYEQPHPGYKEKYLKYVPEMGMTYEQLVASYSVEIIIKPTRLRGA
jgi:hypothetical protein